MSQWATKPAMTDGDVEMDGEIEPPSGDPE
jgi:hypothetical protein